MYLLPSPILFVLNQFKQAGFEAYVVGGSVRDLLLSRAVTDWDFTTIARPQQIQSLFPDSYYDNRFGTVGVALVHLWPTMQSAGHNLPDNNEYEAVWKNQVIEITTFRKEYGYSDNRRPDKIIWGDSIQDDLQRRDFTINAMALMVDSPEDKSSIPQLIDPFSGSKDLTNQLIVPVGNPADRFKEDALRMMRAIRFGAQLGFSLHQETLEAIHTQAKLITYISWERIRDELLKILSSDYSAEGIQLLNSSGILQYILPELLQGLGVKQGGRHKHDVYTHAIESLRACPSSDPIVRLATLLHDIGKPHTARSQGPRGVTFYGHEVVGARIAKKIAQRLRLTNKDVERIFTLVRWHMFTYDKHMTDAAIRRFIRRVGIDNVNDMILLRTGDRIGGGSKTTSWRLQELQKRIGENLYQPLQIRDLAIDGHMIMKTLNLPPGKKIGEILKQLFEEVLDDPTRNNIDYLIPRLKELEANTESA